MSYQPKFRYDQRVILKKVDPCEDYPEGLPEERGVCLGLDAFGPDGETPDPSGDLYEGQVLRPPYLYIVDVDPEYTLADCSDDGFREMVPEEMMEEET